ncbi:hypothetical protein Gogos_010330 [Gossypium gossypioides]|uniref:Uncharacterized protein n=1 Tax=Gossypium gossypioides TaxID=34282 RepID=A0A7J9BKZ1_GOSGO|nr:hypothetical protein [Gossypium gossypioides]
MTKGGDEQNVPMETCGRFRKNNISIDMLSGLEGRVTNLEESMGGVKETLEVIEGHIDELDSMRVQLRDYVVEALSSNWDVMREILSTVMDDQAEKLTEKNDALEAMVTNLEEQIAELKGEVIIYKVALVRKNLSTGLRWVEALGEARVTLISGKPPNWKGKSNNKPKGLVKCFLCDDLHMIRDCQMKYMFSTTEGDDEPNRASMKMWDCPERSKLSIVTKEDVAGPESEALKLRSMILNPT